MRLFRTFALLLCFTSAMADVHDVIPDQYTGRWAGTDQACADPKKDILALTIEPTMVTFPGSVARVEAAVTDGPLKVSVLLDSSSPSQPRAPGETWMEGLEFELSPDHSTLRTLSEGRTVASRVRCRGPAAD